MLVSLDQVNDLGGSAGGVHRDEDRLVPAGAEDVGEYACLFVAPCASIQPTSPTSANRGSSERNRSGS